MISSRKAFMINLFSTCIVCQSRKAANATKVIHKSELSKKLLLTKLLSV